MQKIESWAAENNLVLNKSKTKEIVFGNIGEIRHNYRLQWMALTESPKFRKLGVILQETLSMKEHLNELGVGGLRIAPICCTR